MGRCRLNESKAVIIFPAIDLKGGQVVRLAEGDMDRATVYGDDPAAQAKLFAEAGAEYLHVVDLDGSFAGSAQNREAVESIVAAFPGRVQLGGGIRSQEDVEGWLEAGVSRIVMGSAALKDQAFSHRQWRGGGRSGSTTDAEHVRGKGWTAAARAEF